MSTVAPELLLANEAERMAAVARYNILDTPQDGAFDRITRIAAQVLDVPIAIVTIVDTDRIWFKAAEGLDGVSEIGRDPGLCASAILADEPYIIEDARADPRALTNPLVAGEFGLQFYAGSPLTTSDGYNLGTMCVIDREPRTIPAKQVALLDDLAQLVVDQLELRLAARQVHDAVLERKREARHLNDDVVQHLSVAKLAMEIGEIETSANALNEALDGSKRILGRLVDGDSIEDLRRP